MSEQSDTPSELAKQKFDLERLRFRAELLKWIIIAVGAIVSFVAIDLGRLQLEKYRARDQHERELLAAYLTATESPEPQIWKRKLRVLQTFSTETTTIDWAEDELKYIEETAGLEALYLETLKVASQLVDPSRITDVKRSEARARFEQLYFADLPFFGEHRQVASGMVDFRQALMTAEASRETGTAWTKAQSELLDLSAILSSCTRALRTQRERSDRETVCEETDSTENAAPASKSED